MFKKIAVAIAMVVFGFSVAFGSSVLAQTRTQPTTPSPSTPGGSRTSISDIDRQYMVNAAEAGLANIQMGQLALRRSDNSRVEQFAQAEIAEQQTVARELRRLAPQAGVTLPTAPGPKYQAALRQLSEVPEQQFDSAYLNEGGINAHLEAAALYQREAAFGQNPDLVRLASGGLNTINQHFTTASSLTNYRFAQVPQRFNEAATTSDRPAAPSMMNPMPSQQAN